MLAYAAITRFLPVTNTKGARISVAFAGNRKQYPLDYSVDPKDAHKVALLKFMNEFRHDYPCNWVGSNLYGDFYVYYWIPLKETKKHTARNAE